MLSERRRIFVLLEVKGLGVSLSSEASVVENISFQLHHGEMLSIVGSSGAGKTTICKAIMGLLGTAYRTISIPFCAIYCTLPQVRVLLRPPAFSDQQWPGIFV